MSEKEDSYVAHLKELIVALWMEDCTEEQRKEIEVIFHESNPTYDGTY